MVSMFVGFLRSPIVFSKHPFSITFLSCIYRVFSFIFFSCKFNSTSAYWDYIPDSSVITVSLCLIMAAFFFRISFFKSLDAITRILIKGEQQ